MTTDLGGYVDEHGHPSIPQDGLPLTSYCPNCGDPTVRAFNGHESLCLPCTEVEIGETYEQLRDRVTAKVQGAAKKKWRLHK